jgi:hypothetical protein
LTSISIDLLWLIGYEIVNCGAEHRECCRGLRRWMTTDRLMIVKYGSCESVSEKWRRNWWEFEYWLVQKWGLERNRLYGYGLGIYPVKMMRKFNADEIGSANMMPCLNKCLNFVTATGLWHISRSIDSGYLI